MTVLALFSGTVFLGLVFTIGPARRELKLLKPLKPELRNLLQENFPYYNRLTSYQKKDFEKRLNYFLNSKQFVAKKMKQVTEEMKLLIAACAVQLTFGYEPLRLAHFKKIILYPKRYYSRFTHKKHSGEVNPNGYIVFSWEDFKKGYKNPNDGLNLGLHEMAHALRLEDAMPDGEYAFMDNENLARWHRVCMKEMKKIRHGQKNFIRKYASVDAEEFFAVCIEYFFEKPHEFKQNVPEVYEALCLLLRQDPTARRLRLRN
jgi:Mlc titration factor MtfA (ptsG expression regulator)